MLTIKKHRFLILLIIIMILCCQSPARGTIGLAEWQSPTPGGNIIGSNDNLPPHSGIAIYHTLDNVSAPTVYVKNIHQYGFAQRAIIGEANYKFFWFDETTKAVQYFANQSQLCSAIAAKGLQFYNNLTFFPGSHHYDYYGILYSLYFLIPFLVLLLIHCLSHRSRPLPFNIDRILKNSFFGLQLYGLAVWSNAMLLNNRMDSPNTMMGVIDKLITDVIVAAIALAIVGLPLWGLSQLCLRVFPPASPQQLSFPSSGFAIFAAFLKCLIVLGIFMTGLSLTIAKLEVPWTSIHYFSCP